MKNPTLKKLKPTPMGDAVLNMLVDHYKMEPAQARQFLLDGGALLAMALLPMTKKVGK